MKTNKLAGSICALLLTALSASPAAAQSSTASILFTRTMFRFDSAHGSQLYRVRPSGQDVVTLAPVTYGYDIRGANWSPSGASVVYERVQQVTGNPPFSSQLYVVDRQGGSRQKITSGSGLHSQPLWGPNGLIAFATDDTGAQCLATVHADGTQQHVVFCPPHESGQHSGIQLTLFRWTPSGNGVLIEAAGDEGGLEPNMWYSTVYRVNVSTGAATKLANQVFTNSYERDLAIAPDNKHGVYEGNPMYLVDFASNTRTPVSSYGWKPSYSPNGAKIAFLDTVTTYPHSRLFIMRADGSNIHLAPTQVNPDVTINSISDWSPDSTRLLVNQVGNNQWVRMIDLRNKAAHNVTNGVADKHAWFHP